MGEPEPPHRRADVTGERGGGGAWPRGQHVSDRGLRRLVQTNVTTAMLEQAALPVYVVATDLATGSPVVLGEGPTVDCLLASSAFPGLYPPIELAGRSLIDGGVSADLPILQAEQLGATVCYVLPCAVQQPAAHHGHARALPLAYHALGQLLTLNSRHDLDAATSTVHVLPVPSSTAAHPVDFRDTARLITLGHRLARDELARLATTAQLIGA